MKKKIRLFYWLTGLCSRIQHKLSLDAGTWNARVKAKNADGWSLYSEQEKIVVHPSEYLFDTYSKI